MRHLLCLLKKSLSQRKNMWISSLICELFFPTFILGILVIIKYIVKDEIIYSFSNEDEKGIINYGPICFVCNILLKGNLNGFTYDLLLQIGDIKERKYNPLKMCQISNDSSIAFIGNFSNLETVKTYLNILFAQEFYYKIGTSIKNFTLKSRDFANNIDFENYLEDINYKKENDPSTMKDGICLGIEGNYVNNKNLMEFTLRFSDDYMRKDFFKILAGYRKFI